MWWSILILVSVAHTLVAAAGGALHPPARAVQEPGSSATHKSAAHLVLSVYLSPQVMLVVDDEHLSAGSAAKPAEALRLDDTIRFRTSTAQTDLVVSLAIRWV